MDRTKKLLQRSESWSTLPIADVDDENCTWRAMSHICVYVTYLLYIPTHAGMKCNKKKSTKAEFAYVKLWMNNLKQLYTVVSRSKIVYFTIIYFEFFVYVKSFGGFSHSKWIFYHFVIKIWNCIPEYCKIYAALLVYKLISSSKFYSWQIVHTRSTIFYWTLDTLLRILEQFLL